MNSLPAQCGGSSRVACAPLKSPVFEYIEILRSYLSDVQKAHVRRRIEKLCRRHGMISTLRYADILQSYLTPCQKAGVLERLEAVFSEPPSENAA